MNIEQEAKQWMKEKYVNSITATEYQEQACIQFGENTKAGSGTGGFISYTSASPGGIGKFTIGYDRGISLG